MVSKTHRTTKTNKTDLSKVAQSVLANSADIPLPKIGIRKSSYNQRKEFTEETQTLMMCAIRRALKGKTGDWEATIFRGLSPYQRWTVLQQWMKFVLPTSIQMQMSGEIGIKKIEISYEEPKFEQIENKQQGLLGDINEEEEL